MNIEYLDEELTNFINKFFPNLNWEGQDSSASADLILDEHDTVEDELMNTIADAIIATRKEDFALTIRPNENKLIIYYFD